MRRSTVHRIRKSFLGTSAMCTGAGIPRVCTERGAVVRFRATGGTGSRNISDTARKGMVVDVNVGVGAVVGDEADHVDRTSVSSTQCRCGIHVDCPGSQDTESYRTALR